MDSDVQPDDPPARLLRAARAVIPSWLHRVTMQAVAGPPPAGLVDDVDALVATESERLAGELETLLRTDVDEQRTNPLSLFRAAVGPSTELLRRHDVAPPLEDTFIARRFPGDPYRLGPATWSDIDPSLHEPGLAWGAWKAMTVLRRRREEGLR